MARTVVNLRYDLVAEAMRYTGLRRKVDVVNEGLRLLVAQRKLARLFRRLQGRVEWVGDPLTMRHGAGSR
jgi:Arc/MetJ family transcription regulator